MALNAAKCVTSCEHAAGGGPARGAGASGSSACMPVLSTQPPPRAPHRAPTPTRTLALNVQRPQRAVTHRPGARRPTQLALRRRPGAVCGHTRREGQAAAAPARGSEALGRSVARGFRPLPLSAPPPPRPCPASAGTLEHPRAPTTMATQLCLVLVLLYAGAVAGVPEAAPQLRSGSLTAHAAHARCDADTQITCSWPGLQEGGSVASTPVLSAGAERRSICCSKANHVCALRADTGGPRCKVCPQTCPSCPAGKVRRRCSCSCRRCCCFCSGSPPAGRAATPPRTARAGDPTPPLSPAPLLRPPPPADVRPRRRRLPDLRGQPLLERHVPGANPKVPGHHRRSGPAGRGMRGRVRRHASVPGRQGVPQRRMQGQPVQGCRPQPLHRCRQAVLHTRGRLHGRLRGAVRLHDALRRRQHLSRRRLQARPLRRRPQPLRRAHAAVQRGGRWRQRPVHARVRRRKQLRRGHDLPRRRLHSRPLLGGALPLRRSDAAVQRGRGRRHPAVQRRPQRAARAGRRPPRAAGSVGAAASFGWPTQLLHPPAALLPKLLFIHPHQSAFLDHRPSYHPDAALLHISSPHPPPCSSPAVPHIAQPTPTQLITPACRPLHRPSPLSSPGHTVRPHRASPAQLITQTHTPCNFTRPHPTRPQSLQATTLHFAPVGTPSARAALLPLPAPLPCHTLTCPCTRPITRQPFFHCHPPRDALCPRPARLLFLAPPSHRLFARSLFRPILVFQPHVPCLDSALLFTPPSSFPNFPCLCP